MKSVFVFVAAFLLGAVLALAARTALHKPYAEPAPAPAAPMPAASPHAGHASAATPAAESKPVNTACAVCGMEVDPDIKPASYRGQLVGFGCSTCPAKFAKAPDHYGPHALRNEVAPK